MKQPWIRSAWTDGAFILGPPLATAAAIAVWRAPFESAEVGPLLWLAFVVGVDVSHVYATLYRTYLDPAERERRPALLAAVPLAGWILGAVTYAIGGRGAFWSALAYLAVFHFVRQQYGFLAIYSRHDSASRAARRLDRAAIYSATLYPLVFWHTHLPRRFNWFVEGDFAGLIPAAARATVDRMAFGLYTAILTAYALKELSRFYSGKGLNVPKNLLVIGTAASWYAGIVALNGDLAFTFTNVLSHGIPYLALVWAYSRGRRAGRAPGPRQPRIARALLALPAFLLPLLVLAYLEEGLWDGLVWRDHERLFAIFSHLPRLTDPATLSWVVPLLALPQITHYALDGFVWKLREGPSRDTGWKAVLP